MDQTMLVLRLPHRVKAALIEAAGTPDAKGSNGRTGTVARRYLVEALTAEGLLPADWRGADAN